MSRDEDEAAAIEALKEEAAQLATDMQALFNEKKPMPAAIAMACAVIIRVVYRDMFERKREVSEKEYWLSLLRIAEEDFESTQERLH